MRVAVTGWQGFLGWHTRCAIRSRWGGDAVLIGRPEFQYPSRMAALLADVDAVIHLAGVNRAADEATVSELNPWLAERLVEGLKRVDRAIPLVYGNSTQALGDSAFGAAKREAGNALTNWGAHSGAPVVDAILPNVFGEHGRPHYNSVVATFCYQLVRGETPTIEMDRELPLLHAQRVASILLDAAERPRNLQLRPGGTPTTVTALLDQLLTMRHSYATGDLPDLADPFTRDLFNTYRSFTFPDHWPLHPRVKGDERGELYETVRARGGEAQVFFSTTRPGYTRGQHYHRHKVERFLVLRGSGVIRLRQLFSGSVVEIHVSGAAPAIVDMPTLWVHSITNTGMDELVTLFYADEVLNPDSPDTYAEDV